MVATSCFSCGAAIESEYQNYCRRCGANLRISEAEAHDKPNFSNMMETGVSSHTFSQFLSGTAAAKPQTNKDSEFINRLRRQAKGYLRGLRTLCVALAPINLLLPFSEFKTASHDETCNQAEGDLRQLLQQRMDSVDKVRPIIARKLQEVGIQIITREEALATPGWSCLLINLNLGEAKRETCYSVSMYLEQEVQLVREPTVTFTTRTWQYQSGERSYFADDEKISAEESNELLREIENAMGCFIYDYRFINDL